MEYNKAKLKFISTTKICDFLMKEIWVELKQEDNQQLHWINVEQTTREHQQWGKLNKRVDLIKNII